MSEDSSRSPGAGRALVGVGAGLALVLIVLIVYGGYGQHWGWIGVNGRTATLWDWLHLLLLPLLLPTVVVPAVRPLLTAGVIFVEADEAEEHGHGEGAG